MAKGKRQQRGSSFFDPLIQKYNGNIFKAPDIEISDKIPRLLKDIVCGNLDTVKYMQYFSPKIVYYLYGYTCSEFNKSILMCNIIQFYCTYNSYDHDAEIIRKNYVEKYKIYEIITPLMHEFYLTGNVDILKVIPAKLRQTPVRSIFS